MQRVELGGVELEFVVSGEGPPVVFVHAALFADWFKRFVTEPALSERFQLITYHRIGYAGSDHVRRPVSIMEQADHCHLLLKHLKIPGAHLVGHSSGAAIATQVALTYPESVSTLALLEPAFPAVARGAFVGEAIASYQRGDRLGAVETWMVGVAGPGYASTLEGVLPGAHQQAVDDAATFFEQELPALAQWHFGPDEARRVEVPVLAMLGADSHRVSPAFDQRHERLLAWLPHVEPYVLPGATHLMHVQNPVDAAARLVAFIERHS
jgi:pimeloyl-ACP methyl ester carboxylesterase